MLSVPAQLKEAFSFDRVSESIAIWCFQLYSEEQAKSLLRTRLTGSSMAVDSKHSEMLPPYVGMVGFLLRTYASDVITANGQSEVLNFH